MPKTTTYSALDPKAGMTAREIVEALAPHRSSARVRAEIGFGGMKPGGPIKKLIIEED